jgi:ubiquinone/menaquinone biosynthesis C-methylase UbiE
MSAHPFRPVDFEHPSLLYLLADRLKWWFGRRWIYDPHIEALGLRGDEHVLDFGCGGGAEVASLARVLRRGRITCVDASDFWVRRASRRLSGLSNVELLRGDIRRLELPAATFDAVYVNHVLHDIPPGERQEIARALASKLGPEGQLFVQEPTRRSHGMSVAEIQALMAGAGLHEVEAWIESSGYRGRFLLRAALDPGRNTTSSSNERR